MKKLFALLAPLLLSNVVFAQDRNQQTSSETCDGPVYMFNEVSQRPIFSYRPVPSLNAEAIANQVSGQVLLTAVLCPSGRVTAIEVIEGLPHGVTERAIESARQSKFKPAEKDGRPVATWTKFIFRFGYVGERGPLATGPLFGRIIETVEVAGYRDNQWPALSKRLQTRSGELYNKEQIDEDWRMLLASGPYDKDASTIRIEEGVRGGLVIFFELKEK